MLIEDIELWKRKAVMPPLPEQPRVIVVGSSSAGKSTFAQRLAAMLDIPWIELDALYWQSNWQPTPRDEFAGLVAEATAGETWVADGNYSPVRDVLWPRANMIIWLNYSLPRVFWRGTKRTLARMITRQELWQGNRESFRMSFLSKESILLWILTTHKRREREYESLRAGNAYPHLAWLEFRKPSHAERWREQRNC